MSDRLRPYTFYVLEDFLAEVHGSRNHYLKGHTYTVRPGAVYNDLDDQVTGWLVEGRVALVRAR